MAVVLDTGSNQITIYDTCDSYYESVQTDTKWNAAFWLQFVSWVVGLGVSIGLFVISCVGSTKQMNTLLGMVFLLVNVIFTSLIFLALKSNLCKNNPLLEENNVSALYKNECNVASGSTVIYVAIAFFFIAALFSCLLPDTSEEDQDDRFDKNEAQSDAVVDKQDTQSRDEEFGGGEGEIENKEGAMEQGSHVVIEEVVPRDNQVIIDEVVVDDPMGGEKVLGA
jgi:hypothetical protein